MRKMSKEGYMGVGEEVDSNIELCPTNGRLVHFKTHSYQNERGHLVI